MFDKNIKDNPYFQKAMAEKTPYELIPLWCFDHPEDVELIREAYEAVFDIRMEEMVEFLMGREDD